MELMQTLLQLWPMLLLVFPIQKKANETDIILQVTLAALKSLIGWFVRFPLLGRLKGVLILADCSIGPGGYWVSSTPLGMTRFVSDQGCALFTPICLSSIVRAVYTSKDLNQDLIKQPMGCARHRQWRSMAVLPLDAAIPNALQDRTEPETGFGPTFLSVHFFQSFFFVLWASAQNEQKLPFSQVI